MALEGARPATRADVSTVAELVRQGLAELRPGRGGAMFVRREGPAEPLDAWVAAALDDASRVIWVGTVDDVVLGALVGRVDLLRGGPPLGVIDALVVDPGARGIGVGEAMTDLALAHFSAAGCGGVDATALPGQRDTKNFFEQQGFTARLLVVHRRLGDD